MYAVTSVPLHARQHLRHRGPLDTGEPGQVPLRLGLPALKCHQDRQVADTRAQRLETRLAQTCESRAPPT